MFEIPVLDSLVEAGILNVSARPPDLQCGSGGQLPGTTDQGKTPSGGSWRGLVRLRDLGS